MAPTVSRASRRPSDASTQGIPRRYLATHAHWKRSTIAFAWAGIEAKNTGDDTAIPLAQRTAPYIWSMSSLMMHSPVRSHPPHP